MSWLRRGAAIAAALAALAASPALASGELLTRCAADAGTPVECGRVTVPLDRTGALPGTISLRLRALPATGSRTAGTILALAGGPGQAAVPLLADLGALLERARRAWRLVVYDQRGTGGSGRLDCPALAQAGETAAAVARCAAALGPARTAYASAASVADVEAVRAALGVERLILYGTSYGAKVALDYAAAFPQRVERLVLDSPVLPEGVDPFDRTTLASIPRVLRALCARGACPFTVDPVADLSALVRRLARARLQGSALDANGRPRRVSLTRGGLLELLLAGDFDRHLRAALPAAVRAALDDDPAPLLRLAARGTSEEVGVGEDSDAVYVATTCADGGVPWPAGTPPAQRRAAVNAAAAALPAAAFAPFDRATIRSLGTADLCRGWPESPIVQPRSPLPPVPALVLSGADDLRTPRADAASLVRRLPGGRLLSVPDAGHGALFTDATDCAEQAVVAFLRASSPVGCRGRARSAPTLPLPPRRLAALRPVRGLPGHPGRTVRALLRTLDDAAEQVVARVAGGGDPRHGFGGLRAGSAVLGSRGLRLRGYGYVPGVRVDGAIPSRGARFTLRIGGPAAAPGRVTLSPDGLIGTLDGRDVELGPRELGWMPARASDAAAAGRSR